MSPLHQAVSALDLARAHALLRNDLPAVERLEAITALVRTEEEYEDGRRVGLAQVPVAPSTEWLPGGPDGDQEFIDWLAAPEQNPHLTQLARIEAIGTCPLPRDHMVPGHHMVTGETRHRVVPGGGGA